jgi:hypothetical protein
MSGEDETAQVHHAAGQRGSGVAATSRSSRSQSQLCHPTGTPALRDFFLMNSGRLFEAAIKTAKNLLWQSVRS